MCVCVFVYAEANESTNEGTNERTVPRIATTAHWPIKNSKVISYEIECGFSDDGLHAAVFDAVASSFSFSFFLFYVCSEEKIVHTLILCGWKCCRRFVFLLLFFVVVGFFVHIGSSQWIYFSAFLSLPPSYGSPFSNWYGAQSFQRHI